MMLVVGKESLLRCANCLGMYNLNVNPPVGGFRPCLLFLLPLAGLCGGLSTEGDWRWRNTFKAPFSHTVTLPRDCDLVCGWGLQAWGAV